MRSAVRHVTGSRCSLPGRVRRGRGGTTAGREYNQPVFFKVLGRILDIETIASGKGIRERRRLRKLYGGVRWRKLKLNCFNPMPGMQSESTRLGIALRGC